MSVSTPHTANSETGEENVGEKNEELVNELLHPA